MTQIPIELNYTGDYPGYAFIRINGRLATRAEEDALCTIYDVPGIRRLFDVLGAKRMEGGEEHLPFHGVLTVTEVPQS